MRVRENAACGHHSYVPLISAVRKPTSCVASRLDKLLSAARRTGFYQQRTLNTFAEADPVSIDFVRRHPGLFKDPDAAAQTFQHFEHPVKPPPKTVVLESGFKHNGVVRVSSDGWIPKVAAFHPASLAAAPHRLLSLAVAGSRPRLTHSIVVFVGPYFGALTAEDRDLLWTSFGVPIYEQFRGLGGELLASECDAHDGLHIREEDAIFEERGELLLTSLTHLARPVLRLRTGLCGAIATRLCGCGETSPRLVGLDRAPPEGPLPEAA